MFTMAETPQKTHSASVRLPLDLYERLARLKSEQAHEEVPDSKLLIEAIRLYVTMGEEFGIDKKFKINDQGDAAQRKRPHPVRRPQSA